jgi:hypothetical protein
VPLPCPVPHVTCPDGSARSDDIGAVIFLHKVIWTIPGFNAARYRSELAALHEHIQAEGSFVSHAPSTS